MTIGNICPIGGRKAHSSLKYTHSIAQCIALSSLFNYRKKKEYFGVPRTHGA